MVLPSLLRTERKLVRDSRNKNDKLVCRPSAVSSEVKNVSMCTKSCRYASGLRTYVFLFITISKNFKARASYDVAKVISILKSVPTLEIT